MKTNRRADHLTALLIDAAVSIQAVHGDVAAAKALVRYGVEVPVILRVLGKNAVRRQIPYRYIYG